MEKTFWQGRGQGAGRRGGRWQLESSCGSAVVHRTRSYAGLVPVRNFVPVPGLQDDRYVTCQNNYVPLFNHHHCEPGRATRAGVTKRALQQQNEEMIVKSTSRVQ
ncbi:hypothetical protein AcV5_002029 [Taiwanofungus camphoratus]|nr:hypothetical protein AcV5_002029 [Antrodia cinnamomea]